jgi:nucleotide-binding universal stress UspA family protein
MSFTAAALVVVVIWCVIGFVMSVYMRRRGHAFFTWWYLGSILGPLSVPLAVDAVVRERQVTPVTTPRRLGAGPVSMLVGIDGSIAAIDAARDALALFGDRVGRCVLAYVVDYDASTSRDGAVAANDALSAAAAALGPLATSGVVLTGAAADALGAAARDGGYDVIVAGSRGRGASRAVLGSVASRLARGVGVPVLLGAAASTTHASAPVRGADA